MRTNKAIRLKSIDRQSIRHELIHIFLEEEPGLGKGEFCSFYTYFVEDLANGSKILLKRPARLNKGFDFEVHVEGTNFGTKRYRTMPTHTDIINDLINKKTENLLEFQKVKKIIKDVYDCKLVNNEEILSLKFESGFNIEIILKVIKWLFIEQDITYWNWTGRNMLNDALIKL